VRAAEHSKRIFLDIVHTSLL